MCFTQGISGIIAGVGFLSCPAIYVANRKWKMKYCNEYIISVAYFATMELIQYLQYFVVDDCENRYNRWLTYLAFAHICFQPFFSCLSVLLFSFGKDRESRLRKVLVKKGFLPLSIIGGLWLASSAIMLPGSNLCDSELQDMCGEHTCTISGSRHICWVLRMRHTSYFTPSLSIHFFMMFVPLVVMKCWYEALALFVSGPVAGKILGKGKDEWEGIWCFYSVLQILSFFAYGYFVQKKEAAPTKKHTTARRSPELERRTSPTVEDTESAKQKKAA